STPSPQFAAPSHAPSATPIPHRSVFFFPAPGPAGIYTLSLHDALPIWSRRAGVDRSSPPPSRRREPPRSFRAVARSTGRRVLRRSEEHTSELQSQSNLVCRLLLEKKKTKINVDVRRRQSAHLGSLQRGP